MRDDNDDRYIEKLESENAQLQAQQAWLAGIEARLDLMQQALNIIRHELTKLSRGLGVY